MSHRIRHHDTRAERSRSRSPERNDGQAHRTRSPYRHHHRHKRSPVRAEAPKELPYGSRQLSKRNYAVFRPMFALYLDIQKQKILDDMDEIEAKGRWKSFIGKWNRGELAEGWYDPSTLHKATASTSESVGSSRDRISSERSTGGPQEDKVVDKRPNRGFVDQSSDSDDLVGPAPPGQESGTRGSRKGPRIPNMQDLELKREMETEDDQTRQSNLVLARKADRQAQKAQLDELVPRAEAGTRERRLEKKAEVNAKMKSFRERSPGAEEVPETELMGGGDGISDFKQQKQELERRKNERELRKEEILRARAAEREERLEEYRVKEDKTMAMLRALAKQNFG